MDSIRKQMREIKDLIESLFKKPLRTLLGLFAVLVVFGLGKFAEGFYTKLGERAAEKFYRYEPGAETSPKDTPKNAPTLAGARKKAAQMGLSQRSR